MEEILQLLELEDLVRAVSVQARPSLFCADWKSTPDQADACIGFPGFGLSVEARKRLTIGVELAAKPQLLLFLDEPTSGLVSPSSFSSFLESFEADLRTSPSGRSIRIQHHPIP